MEAKMTDVNISKINFPNQTTPKIPSKRLKEKVRLESLPDLLTVTEVADLLRVSPLTIKRWGKRGKLPAIRINSRGDRRYKKEAVLWLLGIQEAK
jgi:excisionase family DNA binding protein